jgi:hypothetical protein
MRLSRMTLATMTMSRKRPLECPMLRLYPHEKHKRKAKVAYLLGFRERRLFRFSFRLFLLRIHARSYNGKL